MENVNQILNTKFNNDEYVVSNLKSNNLQDGEYAVSNLKSNNLQDGEYAVSNLKSNNLQDSDHINIKNEDANTTNCLALTIQKEHKLVAIKNVFLRSLRMSWKVIVSGITLAIIKLLS